MMFLFLDVFDKIWIVLRLMVKDILLLRLNLGGINENVNKINFVMDGINVMMMV